MRIKDEFYKEDQEAKQAEVKRLEQSITQTLTGKADYGSVRVERD
jgi:hypothetical protein